VELPLRIKFSSSRKLSGYKLPTISKWQNGMRNTKKMQKIRKYLTIVILLLFILSCKKQSIPEKQNIEFNDEENYTEIVNNEIVNNELVYTVINCVLSDKSNENLFRNCNAVLNRKTFILLNYNLIMRKKLDTLFSENDKKFILQQYRNGNKFILNQKFIKDKKVIEVDMSLNSEEKKTKFWERIKKENNCTGRLYVPLFNLKKNLAIIECGIKGEGATFVYKLNRNNKWELYRTLEKWIE
jgi:PBP1b-binding outer membrane lipoprotein LpoB